MSAQACKWLTITRSNKIANLLKGTTILSARHQLRRTLAHYMILIAEKTSLVKAKKIENL